LGVSLNIGIVIVNRVFSIVRGNPWGEILSYSIAFLK